MQFQQLKRSIVRNSLESRVFENISTEYDDDYWGDEEVIIDEIDVDNDQIKIALIIASSTRKKLSKLRLMVTALKGHQRIISKVEIVSPNTTEYAFKGLTGNTTYRVSAEGFADDESLIYTSTLITTSLSVLNWLPAPSDIMLNHKSWDSMEVNWVIPLVATSNKQAMVNQHLVNVLEFMRSTKTTLHRQRHSVRLPKTRILIDRLNPRSVYNITIKACTDFGFGDVGWAVFSTLGYGEDDVLGLKSRTPNSLTLSWPTSWIPELGGAYTIRAKTLHSATGKERDVSINNLNDGQSSFYVLEHLEPGSTFNVTLSAAIKSSGSKQQVGVDKKLTSTIKKSTWAVFSTLRQGEFIAFEPRLVAETDRAASIVWHKIQHILPVSYQIRYTYRDGDWNHTEQQSEESLLCPKMGCEWLCMLIYNLPQHPRDYSYQLRAYVDGVWNKWVPILRRHWNIMERVCSINPPPFFVENVGNEDSMRIIDLQPLESMDPNAWSYLLVIDRRESGAELDRMFASFDITQFSDRATSDYEKLPYYVTAGLSPSWVQQNQTFRSFTVLLLQLYNNFRIGDGRVYGGYLNYPVDKNARLRWFLIPLSGVESEIMEPSIRSCGILEDGTLKCDFTFGYLIGLIPWWIKFGFALGTITIASTCYILITRNRCCNCRLIRGDGPPVSRRGRDQAHDVSRQPDEINYDDSTSHLLRRDRRRHVFSRIKPITAA